MLALLALDLSDEDVELVAGLGTVKPAWNACLVTSAFTPRARPGGPEAVQRGLQVVQLLGEPPRGATAGRLSDFAALRRPILTPYLGSRP